MRRKVADGTFFYFQSFKYGFLLWGDVNDREGDDYEKNIQPSHPIFQVFGLTAVRWNPDT